MARKTRKSRGGVSLFGKKDQLVDLVQEKEVQKKEKKI